MSESQHGWRESGLGNRSRLIALVVAVALFGGVGVYVAVKNSNRIRYAAPLEARLELATGEVTLDDGSGSTRPTSGAAIVGGSHIAAAEGARALLRLSDGAGVFLRGGTRVGLQGNAISIDEGEVWLDAPPEERKPGVHTLGEVEVSASDAGLSLKRSKDEVVVYVARGLAVVTSPGGRVEVQAGERATVKGNGKPEVKPVAMWSDWTGGLGDHAAANAPGAGSGVLYGVDPYAPPGTQAQPLEITRQSVRGIIRSGFAETEVDQTFFNPGDRPIEGWYWFTLPEGATVTGFALETDGQLIEGELIERKEAAAQYSQAVSSGHEPALLEWIDGHTYRTRIFPVAQGGTRRVVVRYLELSPMTSGRLRYVYPMHSRTAPRIGEFSLSVDLGSDGRDMKVTTLAEAKVEEGGRRVTMRRSGFTPRADFQLEAEPSSPPAPVTVARYSAEDDSADYLMMRFLPDVDWASLKPQPGQVVVVVDTSAGGDDADRQLKAAAAEAILRALSSSDKFALVSLDVRPTVLYPKDGLASASGDEIAKALEQLSDHPAGGATDLSAMFDVALSRLHGGEQPSIVYVGDGIPTSGDTRAERLIERLRRGLSTSRARLFTVGVGNDANQTLLAELARAGGGQAFAIDTADQTTERALRLASALKTPTLTDLDIDVGAGLDEVFLSANGKVSRGEEVMLLARSHQDLPSEISVKGRLAGQPFERKYPVKLDRSGAAALAAPLWAAEYIRRTLGTADDPEQVRGKVTSLGIQYGLMTPYTSFLALESENAYRQQGIVRNSSRLRGVRLASLAGSATGVGGLAAGFALAPMGCSAPESDMSGAAVQSVEQEAKAERSEGYAKTARRDSREGNYPAEAAAPAVAAAAPAPRSPAALGYVSGGADEGAAGGMDAKNTNNIIGTSGQIAPGAPAAGKPNPADELMAQKGGMMKEEAQKKQDVAGDRLEMDKMTEQAATGAKDGPARAPSQDEGRAREKLRDDPSRRQITGVDRVCSDLAERPLGERAAVWRKRLQAARHGYALVLSHDAARGACELPDWRAEALFLRLMEERIQTESVALEVLSRLASQPDAQRFLARLILRHALDEHLVAAVDRALYGAAVDWNRIDLELASITDPEGQLKKLRAAVALAPDSPEGLRRLVKALAGSKHAEEAIQVGRRLAEMGLMTPALARAIGDQLADQGQAEEAVRVYSEIVEFAPDTRASRRLLGDLYLAHGWYDPAYRQYQALTGADPRDALGQLRLATAAAGASRVDEGLRIARSVAESEGVPGPTDPRRFARLWSATQLARLLSSPPKEGTDASSKELAESATRKLKELQLFRGQGTLVVLTWEDLAVDMTLSTPVEGADSATGERTDAAAMGLSAVLLPGTDATGIEARLRSAPLERPMKLTRHDIRFDGKKFEVAVKVVELPTRARGVGL